MLFSQVTLYILFGCLPLVVDDACLHHARHSRQVQVRDGRERVCVCV